MPSFLAQSKTFEAYLKEAGLLWIHVIEWYVGNISVLINKHGMTLTKRTTAHVLATETHVKPCTSHNYHSVTNKNTFLTGCKFLVSLSLSSVYSSLLFPV